jgi:ParB family chromosome partitioning protein
MAAKRGLGRGLGVLINDGIKIAGASEAPEKPLAPKQPEPPASGVRQISIDQVRRNTQQPRQRFNEEALNDLTASIRERGILQPLLVRQMSESQYELIAGERRLRAAGQAGLKEVPVILVEAADEDSLVMALVENLQREDLNVIEEALGYRLLAETYNLTQDQIATHMGKSRASVANALRLLKLPDDVQAMVSDGELSAGHAKLLSGLEIPEEQRLLAKRTLKEGLSVRNLEKVMANLKRLPRKPRAIRADIPESHVQYLSDQLHAHFGTSVRLHACRTYANGKKGKGSIEIDFFSNEELSRILDVLGIESE